MRDQPTGPPGCVGSPPAAGRTPSKYEFRRPPSASVDQLDSGLENYARLARELVWDRALGEGRT
jgi:hypothetical protein